MADLEDGFVELDDTNALRGWTVSNLHSFKPAHFNTITSCTSNIFNVMLIYPHTGWLQANTVEV